MEKGKFGLIITLTYKLQPGQDDKEVTCQSESFKCYVLDNNGFVVISEEALDIGKFFGQIDGTILNSLVQNHVFKKIKIFDYQAICLEVLKDGSPANALLTVTILTLTFRDF